MVRSSKPAARELPLLLIFSETISRKKRGTELSSGHSLWSFNLTIWVDGSLVWETAEVNCLAKSIAISPLRVGQGFGGKCDGLIGRGFSTFPMKGN